MALEIKLRTRKSGGNARGRDVAMFVSLDARQSQSAGTVILSDEELQALQDSPTVKVRVADNGDIVLTTTEAG